MTLTKREEQILLQLERQFIIPRRRRVWHAAKARLPRTKAALVISMISVLLVTLVTLLVTASVAAGQRARPGHAPNAAAVRSSQPARHPALTARR